VEEEPNRTMARKPDLQIIQYSLHDKYGVANVEGVLTVIQGRTQHGLENNDLGLRQQKYVGLDNNDPGA